MPSHLGIKRSLVEYEEGVFVLLDQIDTGGGEALQVGWVVTDEDGRVGPVGILADQDIDRFVGFAGSLALLFHFGPEGVPVDGEAPFAGHQFGQVERKAIGVVKLESEFAREGVPFLQRIGFAGEEFDSAVKGLVEGFLFRAEGFFDEFGPFSEFGKGFLHLFDQGGCESVKKGVGKAEGAPVAYAPPQDSTQGVIAVAVAGQNTVRNREAKGSQVIPDDAESNVDFLLLVGRFAICG